MTAAITQGGIYDYAIDGSDGPEVGIDPRRNAGQRWRCRGPRRDHPGHRSSRLGLVLTITDPIPAGVNLGN